MKLLLNFVVMLLSETYLTEYNIIIILIQKILHLYIFYFHSVDKSQ